ncbi:MAG TPA: DUF58 domain-containing protein [Sporichthyaceae bacterium]
MRRFGGLTLRGQSFLVGAVAAASCEYWMSQPTLVRIALLLAALPLVCALVVRTAKQSIACTRVIEPARVPAGDDARVTLHLENASLVPTGLLLAEDTLPRGMSARPRFVIDRLDPRGKRDVFYQVRSQVRGRYRIGPLTLRVTDPFGMCEVSKAFPGTVDLIVIPVVEQLPVVLLGGEWTGSNDSHPSSIPSAGEDDIGTREYRHGDPLHRVHWRSTARRGELMVRREEHPRQSRATILLDARSGAHHGEGKHSSLEWGVSAAASLAVHLTRREFTLRVLNENGNGLAGLSSEIIAPLPDVEGLLLDALAVLEATATPSLREAGLTLGRSADGLVIAVLGSLSRQDASDLSHRRQGTTTAIALLLRTETWVGVTPDAAAETEFQHNVALLRNVGWRVVVVRAGDRLPDLWPLAARTGTAADGRSSVPA